MTTSGSRSSWRGNYFFLARLGESELGIGQRVAQIESALDRPGRIGKVAARALRRPGGRLRFVSGQQCGKVKRRNRDPGDNDLRNIDSPIDNDENPAIGQFDDQVAALDPEVVERRAFGQNDNIARPRNQRNSVRAASHCGCSHDLRNKIVRSAFRIGANLVS